MSYSIRKASLEVLKVSQSSSWKRSTGKLQRVHTVAASTTFDSLRSQQCNDSFTHLVCQSKRNQRQNGLLTESFNLLPIYNIHSNRLPTQRIGMIRWMNSGSSKDSNSSNSSKNKIDDELSTKTELSHAQGATKMRNNEANEIEGGNEKANPVIAGLKNSMDTTIQQVRSKVDPKDLLYYFVILATFCVLIVGPIAAQHMQISDTDYDALDPEDPVADLATFMRIEFLKDIMGDKYDEESSKMGGLDTLLADLLRSPQIQGAINDLVNNILNSSQFKRSCSILLKELWKDLVEDPETLQQVIHLLHNAIQDEKVKDAAVQLATEVFGDKEVVDEVVELFQRLGKEQKVQLATQELLVESAHNALNDPEILDHSMEFATDVVGDDVVQQTAGEALYNSLSYAVRPTISLLLVGLGTGLIFMSLVAFQHSMAPQSQSKSLERTLESFERSNVLQMVLKVMRFPWTALVTCKDAVFWLIMLPFRTLSETLAWLGNAGNTIIDSLNKCIAWIFRLPITLAEMGIGMCANVLMTMSHNIAKQSRELGRSLSGSFLGLFFQKLADSIAMTTRYIRMGWIISNKFSANAAIVIETEFYRTMQFFDHVLLMTTQQVVQSKYVLRDYTNSIRHAWVGANHRIADASLACERRVLSTKDIFANMNRETFSNIALRGGFSLDLTNNISGLSLKRSGIADILSDSQEAAKNLTKLMQFRWADYNRKLADTTLRFEDHIDRSPLAVLWRSIQRTRGS